MTNLHDYAAVNVPLQGALTKQQSISAAPGKLIISGEHSVLYAQPALAIAINRHTHCTVKRSTNNLIEINLPDLNFKHTYTVAKLQAKAQQLQNAYEQYLAGNNNIRNVITHPANLLEYAVAKLLNILYINTGISIELTSNIPIGCGMGSSAAAISSMVYALADLCSHAMYNSACIDLCQQIENLQHGRSSGLDVRLSLHGGCVLFENSQAFKRNISRVTMYIVNTGQPLSTTGECVTQAAKLFNASLAQEFGQVTRKIDFAITNHDLRLLCSGIKENQLLLQKIGVVPAKVTEFISQLEKIGASAKVCGAGAVYGENAGMLLVVGPSNINELVSKYGYEMHILEVDTVGTRIV